MSEAYIHRNVDEGVILIRVGTRENGTFIELYADGTWGYTVLKNGKIVESMDFNHS
jgi:hypothetical protein